MMLPDDKHPEDYFMCDHEWSDLYNGAGVDRHNKEIALVTFFCKHCLQIRVKSYNQSRFQLTEFHEQGNEDEIV